MGVGTLANFTRQLATMVQTGLTLVEALAILESQYSGYMAKVVSSLKRIIEGGSTFAQALGAYPKIFDNVFVSLVTAGEKAGILDKVLNRLAETLEKRKEFQAKVISALIYPIMIMIAMVGAAVVVLVYVIPQLMDLYSQYESQLPWMTLMLMQLSNFTRNYWYIEGVIIAMLIVGSKIALKTPDIRRRWERLQLSLPIVGTLIEGIQITELTRTLSLLSAAGVPIVQALELVAEGQSLLVYEDGVRSAIRLVEKGTSLSDAFAQQDVFPSIVAQMLSVGEETGKVDEIMGRVSAYFESESDHKVKGLTSAFEPIILMVLACGVAFLVFAIIMPIYNLTTNL